jgi:hypothetical protein
MVLVNLNIFAACNMALGLCLSKISVNINPMEKHLDSSPSKVNNKELSKESPRQKRGR